MKIKKLSKKVIDSLTTAEKKQLEKLTKKHKDLGDNMLKVHTEYSIAARNGTLSDAALRKMADKGFKAEFDTMDAADALTKYINSLYTKYNK